MSDGYGPTVIDFDLASAILKTIDAWMAPRAPRPLGPMIVPDWLPDLCDEQSINLDAEARRYGFDGYVTASASLPPARASAARYRAARTRSDSGRSQPAAG